MPLLCFASPKGGVGKTTLAANVAATLAAAGARVIALDLDPQNALRLHFGVRLGDTQGWAPALFADARRALDWRAALRRTPSGVALLAHGSLDSGAALALAMALAGRADILAGPVREMLADPALVVIVDSPPGPSQALAALLPLADRVVTVLLADATSVSLIPAVHDGTAYGAGVSPAAVGFVLNQVDLRTRLGPSVMEAARRHLGARLLGQVYRDENVAEAVAAQRFVADYAPASRAAVDIALLARTLAGGLCEAAAPAAPVPRPAPGSIGGLAWGAPA